MKANVYRSRVEDANQLAPLLRDEDVREIRDANGSTPLESLTHGVTLGTRCYTVADSDQPVAMFGVMPNGAVWLLASENLLEHRRQLVRESRRWLREMHRSFPVLWNYVDTRNRAHVRFLEWLGVEWGQKLRSKPHFRYFQHVCPSGNCNPVNR